jgi:hypothetical protein
LFLIPLQRNFVRKSSANGTQESIYENRTSDCLVIYSSSDFFIPCRYWYSLSWHQLNSWR